jgi:hypothetical protein
MSEQNRPKERRLHPRFVVEGKVELGGGPEGPAVLCDLSISGFSCVSPIAFEDMTVLEIAMQLPYGGENRPFKAGGAVVRCVKDGSGGHLVAVFFTQMDETNSQLLAEFIEQQGS